MTLDAAAPRPLTHRERHAADANIMAVAARRLPLLVDHSPATRNASRAISRAPGSLLAFMIEFNACSIGGTAEITRALPMRSDNSPSMRAIVIEGEPPTMARDSNDTRQGPCVWLIIVPHRNIAILFPLECAPADLRGRWFPLPLWCAPGAASPNSRATKNEMYAALCLALCGMAPAAVRTTDSPYRHTCTDRGSRARQQRADDEAEREDEAGGAEGDTAPGDAADGSVGLIVTHERRAAISNPTNRMTRTMKPPPP